MLLNAVMYLALKDEIMRAKRFEKLLERRRKKVNKATEKIEQADQTSGRLYTTEVNGQLLIDWELLAKHIREALRGR
jgi:hypothetical protein